MGLRAGVAGLALCAAAAAFPTVAAASAPASASPAGTRPDVILSNETTYTTWTVADYVGPIRSAPSPDARRVASLQYQTPDGFLQSYVLLRERRTRSGAWIQLRIPGRPNGRIGWVPRRNLDSFHHTKMEVVVDRAARQLTVYRAGRPIFETGVGVGKPSTPTPAGHFWITESFGGYNDPFYGPWAFGTSDYSTLSDWPGGGIVGIHGTNAPWLVPGDPSHGCIRVHDSEILQLSHIVQIGTPLLVK